MTLHVLLVGKVQWLAWAKRTGSTLVVCGRAERVVLLSLGNTCVAGPQAG